MKKKEFFHLVQPLTDKLYRLAHCLLPDDLQAEQLVIDSLNAFLIKENKAVLYKDVDLTNKKNTLLMRRHYFKGIIRYLSDIGIRRSLQLSDHLKNIGTSEYKIFYGLDPKVRLVITLRYEYQFTVDEIEDMIKLPRYEVIEKIHNGRFLLLNDLNKDVSP